MKPGKLYGVGIGPGDPQYLTLRAVDVLRSADVIFTVVSKNASGSISQSVVEQLRPRGEIQLQVFSLSHDNAACKAQVQDNTKPLLTNCAPGATAPSPLLATP